jgi:hypothetical protein
MCEGRLLEPPMFESVFALKQHRLIIVLFVRLHRVSSRVKDIDHTFAHLAGLCVDCFTPRNHV